MAALDPPSDEALLAAHVAGDPDAFAELFRRHSDKLWAVALRTCRDPDDAADAVQDAMISAFRRAETFRGQAKVSTWLHRIVVNASLDRIRARKSRPTVPLSDAETTARGAEERDRIDEHVTRLTVLGALDSLPEDQRLALTLVDLHGWTVQETAQILAIPPGTVKSRCFRARARLYELLRNQGQPGGVPPDVAPGTSSNKAGG